MRSFSGCSPCVAGNSVNEHGAAACSPAGWPGQLLQPVQGHSSNVGTALQPPAAGCACSHAQGGLSPSLHTSGAMSI